MSDNSPQQPAELGALDDLEPPAPNPVYAGFWRRVVAWIIDCLLLGVPLVVMVIIFFPEMMMLEEGEPPPVSVGYLIFQVVVIAAWIAYMAGFESSRYQATVGKHILGIMVTDHKFRRASFGRCVKRGWFYWLPSAVALIDTLMQFVVLQLIAAVVVLVSCVMVAFTARKQALHDIIANCYLIRRNEARD